MSEIEALDPTRWQREWSPRKARFCPKCQARNLGDLEWVCGQHGLGEDQEDRPYMGEYPKAARPALKADLTSHLVGAARPPDGVTYGAKGKAS